MAGYAAAQPQYRSAVGGPALQYAQQYGDYAVWQQSMIDTKEFQASLKYWQQHLGKDPEPLDMPTTFPRPKVLQPDGAAVTATMSGVAHMIRDMTRPHGAVKMFVHNLYPSS